MTPEPRHRGRPRTGVQPGERISDYERITIRLPPDGKARLMATATVTGLPAWRLLLDGIDHVIRALPDADRTLIAKLAKRTREHGEA